MTDKNANTEICKEFCPNCEAETPCTHEAELFVCDICGEDFAKYIVSRNCNVSDVSMTQDVSIDVKTPQSIENNNPDYYKGVEKSVVDKSALVRLCGVLGVLTENNDLATAALLAATRIERLEKKIPALNVDLAEASMHAYNGEIARMKLETRIAELEAERRWIPVSERLPEIDDGYCIEVWAVNMNSLKPMAFRVDYTNFDGFETLIATHWMPIEAPKNLPPPEEK